MVFESLVADLLNKYLGQYVKNLDASQLKIGIWGGNVVLDNLELKDTALDDLDLPIKVVRGYLGKLELAIPWKNLYTESTVVDIQDLHLVAKPNFDIKYNEEREEKSKKEKKQKQLENIEEARRLEEEKKLKKENKPEESDGFAQKLATNVIKNLQVTIKNIHIRYEDSVSDISGPFALGITLESLSAQTTDGDFIPKIIKESVTIIHKLVKLDNLAVYWNPGEKSDGNIATQEWLKISQDNICTHDNKISDMNYILSPMVASQKLKINTKPGLKLDIPQMFMNLVLKELGLNITRSQYHGVVQLLESFERMNRNQPFKKYRPITSEVPLIGNAKIWWKYCITSILEEDVRRRRKMWSWENIRNYRASCKKYKENYKEKIKGKSPSKQLLGNLQLMEDELNIASITIFRRLAESELMQEKKQKKDNSSGGFFGFFSRSKPKEPSAAAKIEGLMGSDSKEKEMQKLYDAIGYSENEVITPFPKEYIAVVVESILQRLSLKIIDDTLEGKPLVVINFSLENIIVEVQQRPSAQALRAAVKIGQMKLFGTPITGDTPLIIKNMLSGKGTEFISLVDFVFETNPLEKPDIDQCITAVCQPLEIIYDTNTITKIIAFAEPPQHVILQDLQEKAYSTFEDFKISSTAGMLHAMETRTIMDIDVQVSSSHLIIPEKGVYSECTDMVVIDFGSFSLKSDPSQVRNLDPKDIDNIEEVQTKAYDRFLLKLNNLQVLLCKDGEDFRNLKDNEDSKLHILHPIEFDGKLAKAILPQDPRLKQICVSGELTSLYFSVSDDKVARLIKLVDSIPLPGVKEGSPDGDQAPMGFIQKALSLTSLIAADDVGVSGGLDITVPSLVDSSEGTGEFFTPPDDTILTLEKDDQSSEFSSGVANQVKVELKFNLSELKLCIAQTDKELQTEKDCVQFIVEDIGAEVTMRRWDMFVNANIGRLVLNEMTWGEDGEPFEVLSTPKNTKMLKLSYRHCGFNESLALGPSYFFSDEAQVRALQFKDEYQSTEQMIDMQVAMLYLILHQEALLSIMSLVYQVLEPLNKKDQEAASKLKKNISAAGSRISLSMEEKEKKKKEARNANTKAVQAADELKSKVGLEDEKKMRVTASMDGVGIMICSAKVDLAQAYVKGLSANVLMKDDKLEVKASMKDMQVQDNVGVTNYKKIISMQAEEVFDLEIAVFENGTKGSKSFNMACVDTSVKLNIGQMRVVFLYRFIMDLKNFVDNFEDAKNAVVEASKAAKAKAVEAASELSKHSSRIQLNVVLRAPTIVLPVGSTSDLALLVDLGELRVFNKFQVVNESKYNKNAAITDNMTVRLADLKLMKSLIKDGENIMHQRAIVEPMALQLGVIRNLTPANHIVADVEVEGDMPAITLSISEEDIAVALKILQGNIAEGEAHAPPKKKKGKKDQKDTLNLPQDRLASIYEEPEDETAGNECYTKIRLKFDLQNIDVKLYLKPPDMTFEDEFLERNDEWLLSLFTIGNLKIAGQIMSDESMKISVLLSTLILDDMRPSEDESLKRMINYSPDPLIEEVQQTQQQTHSDSKNMLDLKFEQSATLDKKIELSLSNLLCIFNMEFIMVLVRTLLAVLPKDDADRRGSISSVDSPRDESSDDEADTSYMENYAEPENQAKSETRVQVHVLNPQIVLLADAKDLKTNALFLTTEIDFQYIEVDDVQKMIGSVSHSAILSTAFKKEHRSDISTVLSIDSVNFLSSAPLNGKPHMHVNSTLVKLNISPKTIQTLTACSGYISSPESKEERLEKRRMMCKLWDIKEFTNKKLWYLDTPPQHVLSAGSFVIARTENGVYKHGFLSKKDTHFTVFFYPEGQISHKVADVTSVVNDIAPKASELHVGVNVIACQSKESGFRVGRVVQIWKEEGKAKDVVVEGDWDTLGVDATEKFLVRFYHDSSEGYYLLEEMRLVVRPRKGVVPGVGAFVYARYTDGFYYHGLVERVSEFKIRIDLEEIGEEIDHDFDDPSAVILNMTPLPQQMKKHFKVIASKSESTKGYHPGKVMEIQGNPGSQSYTIRFEDGTRNQVPITKLLLMPKAPYDALPELGTYVYSRVARDAPLYEKGIVAEKKDRICVKHLNGRKLAHEIQNIGFVVRNIVPLASSLHVGQDVIAQADSDDQKMFLAQITDIVPGEKANRYMVKFTDGSKKKLTPGRIRILSQYGSEDTTKELTNLNVARKEQLVVEVEGVSLRVEGYLGGLLTPMLKLDSKMTASIKDWSTKMKVGALLSVRASYYNDIVAEWEPLIEPIIEYNGERPWQLSIDYAVEDDNMDSGDSKSNDNIQLQKPESTVKIESHDNLEITLSNSCIGLLGELTKVFGEAVEKIDVIPQVLTERDPFLIENKLGKNVNVVLNELLKGGKEEKSIALAIGEKAGVFHALEEHLRSKNKLPTISIQVEGFHEIKDVAVKRQRTVIYDLIPKKLLSMGSAMYSVVIQVKASDGQRIITIRSPLQLKNHFPMPLDVSYITKENKPSKLSTVDSGATYSIPLLPAYHSLFHIKPAGFGYNDSTEEMNWSDLKAVTQKEFVCFPCTGESTDAFFVQVVMEEDCYTSIHGMTDIVPKYTMHCYPPMVLHNYLPYPIKYRIKGMGSFDELAGGKSWPLFTINVEGKPLIELELENYLGSKWTGSITVSSRRVDSSKPVSFIMSSGDQKVELGVYYLVDGALQVTLYSPYWLLNKTGKTLVYQAVGNGTQTEHPETYDDALMLFVKGKKKKAKLCLKECGWSSEFSLDTIGSGGSLKSEGIRGRLYEVGVGISLSYFGLTKIVTFTPLRMLINHTDFKISMAEFDSETAEWHTVQPNESIPYWPTKLPLKNLYLNINGKDSVKFNPDPGATLLLKFENEIGGVCVNYQEKDSSSVLSFGSYFDGAAPVRIENLCKKISMISYKQVDHNHGHVLTYGQSELYTWRDPTVPHELICSVIEAEESETKIKLDINDFGRMKIKDGAIYWVSFLDGLQRVLLFTDNFKSAYCASQEQTLRPSMQLNFSIESLGLSLANVDRRMEIGYLAIRQSESVWEQRKKNRWKPLPIAMSDALEEGYISYEQKKGASKEKIRDKEVDFEKMFITKPEKIKIRRTFNSGIDFQYTLSPNRMQIRATISSLQLDSHIPGSTFLTVIHVVKPPKSIASESAPKPFFELSLTTRIGEKNVVNEVNYFKVLIQELDVRIDKGFLLGLMEMFTNEKIRGTERERYALDMSQVSMKFEDSPELRAAKQDRHYVFSYFHLSPLKIRVSFSMTGGHSGDGETQSASSLQGNVLGLLLQSVGVAFTEIQDVEFKLACFEVESSLLSNAQLTGTIAKHYQNQAIKQLYVLVLGLDVLGNPYGLITGVGAGAKNFFYEPYQGLIQGPEEFAEGLSYGVKSLVGGTVGGVSGAVSKITGTVGKGLAALTMDDEYQQKRRQAMSQRPTNLGQGLAKGGKGLVKGIFSGVTGVVTKPYEGAKSGGAGGFVKGIGKGLIGVVARPAGGVVDMASSTFEGLKSTTSGIKSVGHIRISRVFHADKVLRPFNVYEADGNKILRECDKGVHAKTEFYIAHVYPVDKKNYLILTNKGIMLVAKSEILNDWESSWYIKFTDLKGEPEIKDTKITFQTHNKDGRKSIFKKSTSERIVALENKNLATWFMSKIKDAKLL